MQFHAAPLARRDEPRRPSPAAACPGVSVTAIGTGGSRPTAALAAVARAGRASPPGHSRLRSRARVSGTTVARIVPLRTRHSDRHRGAGSVADGCARPPGSAGARSGAVGGGECRPGRSRPARTCPGRAQARSGSAARLVGSRNHCPAAPPLAGRPRHPCPGAFADDGLAAAPDLRSGATLTPAPRPEHRTGRAVRAISPAAALRRRTSSSTAP